jgi:putative acetyltransferase
MQFTIRKELPADIDPITDVTVKAFENHPISRQTEQFIVKALRADGALTISLVAEINGKVEGHIAFSPVIIEDGTTGWYGLGPVSVLPVHQKQGIGSSLLNKGLDLLKELNAKGCTLVGDPEFYKRFGFKHDPGLIHEGIPQQFFLVLPFTTDVPKGIVRFHAGFTAQK